MADETKKLKLGGMALRNGLLVHGPKHWAAAVRRDDGTIAVASGRKPHLRGRAASIPGLRGVLRLSEAMAVIPLVKRDLPEARLPFHDATVIVAMAAAATAGSVLRRRAQGLGGEAAVAAISLAPTRIFASDKINVIPSRARLAVDCRTPPGMEEDQVRRRIHEVLGGDGYTIEFFEKVVGNSSPPDTPLMDALRGWIAREDPEARVVPTMLPAFTDSRTFRAAFPDCVAYGFFPQREMTLYETSPLVHSRDERIHTADLGFAARCYRDVTKELLGD